MTKPYYEKTFERHKKDLEDVKSDKRDDIRFVKKIGLAYVAVIEQLKHFKGELAGQRIKLEDWQKKALVILFGWQKMALDEKGNPIVQNGKTKWIRRFNTAFFFIARKNGKSILASGVAIAEAVLSVEKGNEIVSFATKKDQAKIVWSGCEKMIKQNRDLQKNTTISYTTITVNPTETTIKPLGRDSKTEDGLSIGLGIGDEIHAAADRSMINVVESSMSARVQPLMFYITTAGFNRYSPGYEEYKYAKKVMDGAIEDDSYFAFIAELDKDDDPFDENVWHKANPNLGVSKKYDFMRKQAKQATLRTETKNNFLVKDLNKWANATESFIDYIDWEACEISEIDTSKATAVICGVDLSRTDDFTATAETYIFENGTYYTTQHYYIPKNNIKEREKELRVPLTKWVLEGYITATEGDTIDFDYIEKDLIERIEKGINEICYDPYKASRLVANIEKKTGFDGFVQIRQGFLSISEPTFDFRDLIKAKKLLHDKNPVTNWMVSNLEVVYDPAGNVKPNKSDKNKKIDGCAAIINTLARVASYKDKEENIYNKRGMRDLG